MTPPGPARAPAGVRPAAPRPPGSPRLRWVDPGDLALVVGDRIVVHEGGDEWLGEVTVAPDRLVEWPALGSLPRALRRVTAADDWPPAPERAGRALLRSLGLAPEALASARRRSAQGSAQAAVAQAVEPGGPEAGQHERADQEDGGQDGQPQ